MTIIVLFCLCQLCEKLTQFSIALQHIVKSSCINRGRFLCNMSNHPGFRKRQITAVSMYFIADHRKQTGFTGAIGAGQTDTLSGMNHQIGSFKQ